MTQFATNNGIYIERERELIFRIFFWYWIIPEREREWDFCIGAGVWECVSRIVIVRRIDYWFLYSKCDSPSSVTSIERRTLCIELWYIHIHTSPPLTMLSSSAQQPTQQHRQRTQQQRFISSSVEEFQPYRDDPVRLCSDMMAFYTLSLFFFSLSWVSIVDESSSHSCLSFSLTHTYIRKLFCSNTWPLLLDILQP